ncbi:hypothetical protein QJS04_geneDACA021452 [Acorus gramineus]|uniref:Uncharacterized protein n=1 Tax=Acorus gramineus TaxID=55184 RepID=A0AAV9BAV3_ACOGR|nr:hypothetical protein QJS04_geneDACA021452 [Acorus gramineus]
MSATDRCFSEAGANYCYSSFDGQSTAVWLLVLAASDMETEPDHCMENFNCHPISSWRLALLAKDMVIMGDTLDPRASAANALAGIGILGTCDGLVYSWELSSGKKVATLHPLKGGVSCIAVNSRSDALAVASNDECVLHVYVKSPTEC